MEQRDIFTIGHSTRHIDDFIALLKEFEIGCLMDIRHFPGSRKYPQFNKEAMQDSLKHAGIGYRHLVELGGRRKVHKNSHNTCWRNASFRAYADYMETDDFKQAIETLQTIARRQPTAYMCSEAVWWRCHRSLVSDYLKAKGWKVWHIMAPGKLTEHPYTSPARVVGGNVVYFDADLFHQGQ